MTEKEAIAEIDRKLDLERQRLMALPLVEVGHDYAHQFNKQPDFSIGQVNLVEQIILDIRQHALLG